MKIYCILYLSNYRRASAGIVGDRFEEKNDAHGKFRSEKCVFSEIFIFQCNFSLITALLVQAASVDAKLAIVFTDFFFLDLYIT